MTVKKEKERERKTFKYSTKDYEIADKNGKFLSTRKEHQILKRAGYMYRSNDGLWHFTKKVGNNNYYEYIHITASMSISHHCYDYQLWSLKGFQKLNTIFTNLGYFIPDFVPEDEWGQSATHIINKKKKFKEHLIKECNNITNIKTRQRLQHQLTKRLPLKKLKAIANTLKKTEINKIKLRTKQLRTQIKEETMTRKENNIGNKNDTLHKILAEISSKPKRTNTTNKKIN